MLNSLFSWEEALHRFPFCNVLGTPEFCHTSFACSFLEKLGVSSGRPRRRPKFYLVGFVWLETVFRFLLLQMPRVTLQVSANSTGKTNFYLLWLTLGTHLKEHRETGNLWHLHYLNCAAEPATLRELMTSRTCRNHLGMARRGGEGKRAHVEESLPKTQIQLFLGGLFLLRTS